MQRHLFLRLVRNPEQDAQKQDIQYSGFNFYWPDGRAIQTGLNKFCHRGVATMLGKNTVIPEVALLKLTLLPVDRPDAPWPKRPPGVRSRRLYLMRHGRQGVIYFPQGIVTDLTFDELKDEEVVLRWIGLTPDLGENDKAWFDVMVETIDQSLNLEESLESFYHEVQSEGTSQDHQEEPGGAPGNLRESA
jgi:hypothetical protein